LVLFGESKPKVINVSSVPQRSPFRYPGGKTWLIPYVRQWLNSCGGDHKTLIEPFAGGGIVSLTAVAEERVKGAVMVEFDEDIAAVWRTILGRDGEWLANKMTSFSMTESKVESILAKRNSSMRDNGFAVLLKNRVSHGGILAEGAGFIKSGENGRGLLSRWYPETLKRRILDIQRYKANIEFVHGDGFEVLKKNAGRKDSIYFIDPPYTVAGRRLYRHSEIDHAELFRVASKLKGTFLMTYDNAEEIRHLAITHSFEIAEIPMKGTHHSEKMELLISRDLSWLKAV
jgi:DNA adenine methylase